MVKEVAAADTGDITEEDVRGILRVHGKVTTGELASLLKHKLTTDKDAKKKQLLLILKTVCVLKKDAEQGKQYLVLKA
jgi:hypothetical protein